MIMLFFFIVPALFFGIADLVPDFRAGQWKIPIVYITLTVAAFALWICVDRSVSLKSPSEIVTSVLKLFLPIG